MVPTKPILVVFGISHFCEKARWALDWHGIPYTEIAWPPGVHRALLKYYGAQGSSLPVLLDGTPSLKEAAQSSTGERAKPKAALKP